MHGSDGDTTAAYDAAAKEAELRAESATWDTSAPVPAGPDDIPIVDVGPWFDSGDPDALAEAAAVLRRAGETVGFHQLVGHGIDEGERTAILDAARRFHALGEEVKQAIRMDQPGNPGGVGYLGYGNRKLPTRDRGNRNAAFIVKHDVGVGHDDNLWPDEAAVPGFRTAVTDYERRISELAVRLLPLYAAALELPHDFFAPAFEHPLWRLRLTHYPPGEPRGDGGFGIAPHVDTTFFTLLLPDGPGLTIHHAGRDEWIEVPLIDGAFVVNSGELLRQWSNDHVLSTRHFADNPQPVDRYSVPFFFNATADFVMHCLPTCHGPDDPPRYPPFSYNESQGVVQGE